MDYEINLEALEQKNNDLQTLIDEVTSLQRTFNNSYINTLSGSAIGSVVTKINNDIQRLTTAYNNVEQWLNSYCQDLESLENNLTNFNVANITPPTEFKGAFYNLFSKPTIPTLKTGGNKLALYNTLGESIIKDSFTGASINSTLYNNPANLTDSKLDFINSIIDGAVNSYNKYGILPSLTLAQAILESGWGKSPIGHNLFGIKAGKNWTGKTRTSRTSEQNKDGSYKKITAVFRDYDTFSESVEDHAKLLTNTRYQKVIASKNYIEACKAVKECGYATSLSYSKDLINIIEKYGLNQWDPKLS